MSSPRKKAIIRKWTEDWLPCYLLADTFISAGTVETLDLSGKVHSLPADDLKWICFVRDFNSGEVKDPERLLRKSFQGRPRLTGLWIRATLRDEDILEGSSGLFLTPPDTRSNTQRLFLPASSVVHLEVVSVVKAAAPLKPARRMQPADTQPDLFAKRCSVLCTEASPTMAS